MPDEAATKDKQAKADEEAKKEGKEAADPVEPVMKSEAREAWDWRVQNDNKPLWTRSPKDVRHSSSCFACIQSDGTTLLCVFGKSCIQRDSRKGALLSCSLTPTSWCSSSSCRVRVGIGGLL